MERRKAVIAAATASLTLVAGAVAIGLNTSLVGASGDDGAGEISPVEPASSPSTIYIDELEEGRAPAPSRSDDDDDEFDEDEIENDGGDELEDDGDEAYEDEDHEYEGADDDD